MKFKYASGRRWLWNDKLIKEIIKTSQIYTNENSQSAVWAPGLFGEWLPTGDVQIPGLLCSALSCDTFMSQLCRLRRSLFHSNSSVIGPFVTEPGTGDTETNKV